MNEPSDILLTCTGVGEKLFHHQVCKSDDMTFKIPEITGDVGLFKNLLMYYVRVGLHGPGWLYVLGMPPRADFPLSTPRARAADLGRGPNLRMGSGRAPCVPRAESTRKDPWPEEEKMPNREKTHLYMYICSRM